jgi:methyltransferase
MALNKYMHPRNTYKKRKPDFQALSTKFDYFKEKVTINETGKVILDFKDPAALRALTRALLEDDFGLTVTLPLDRLIPTVPQRLNYILWLEDIIGKENGAKGIDIGK